MTYTDDSTTAEKLTVCLTAFGLSCAAFFGSVLLLVPLTAGVCEWLAAPDLLVQALVFAEVIGLPIVAALCGIAVGGRQVLVNRQAAA